jgi:hypothetical protein
MDAGTMNSSPLALLLRSFIISLLGVFITLPLVSGILDPAIGVLAAVALAAGAFTSRSTLRSACAVQVIPTSTSDDWPVPMACLLTPKEALWLAEEGIRELADYIARHPNARQSSIINLARALHGGRENPPSLAPAKLKNRLFLVWLVANSKLPAMTRNLIMSRLRKRLERLGPRLRDFARPPIDGPPRNTCSVDETALTTGSVWPVPPKSRRVRSAGPDAPAVKSKGSPR